MLSFGYKCSKSGKVSAHKETIKGLKCSFACASTYQCIITSGVQP